MPIPAYAAALLAIVVTWLQGGAFVWGSYVVGGGGALVLVLALVERYRKGVRPFLPWSWRMVPWLLLVGMIAVSAINVSHRPIKSTPLAGEITTPQGGSVYDTLGLVNPSVQVEHREWLPATSNRDRTLRYGLAMGGIFCFAVGLVLIPWRREEIRRFLAVLFFNAILLALAGIWFRLLDPTKLFGKLPAEGGAGFGSFHYKNFWAAYAILMLCVGIGLIMERYRAGAGMVWRGDPIALYLCLSPLLIVTIPMCESRAGVLLLGMLVFWLAIRILVVWRREGNLRALHIVAVAGAIGLAGWFSWATMGEQVKRMLERSTDQVEQVSASSLRGRLVLMRDTVEMAKAKPLYGWGLATFSQVYPVFQGPEMYSRIDLPDDEFVWVPRYIEFAHSDWLQFCAEIGLAGVLLLLATPVAWFVRVWRRSDGGSLSHWLGVGCVLILILAIVEFPFGCEAVVLVFAAMAALGGIDACVEESLPRRTGGGTTTPRWVAREA